MIGLKTKKKIKNIINHKTKNFQYKDFNQNNQGVIALLKKK